MQVEIDLRKTVQENAEAFFEASKKAKKKLGGLEEAVKETKERLGKETEIKIEKKKIQKKRQRFWFEKFRWFYSSNNFLVLAGRDVHSNEDLVKNYMKPEDLYFHADIQGSAHVVVKSEGRTIDEETKREAAEFAAANSSAWKLNYGNVDVYSVKPEQVSKKAPSGEAMGTGAFMIYGKRDWFRKTKISFGIGIKKMMIENEENWVVISGPLSAVKKHAVHFAEIRQGKETTGKTIKLLQKFFKEKTSEIIDADEIMRMLPSGGFEIKF